MFLALTYLIGLLLGASCLPRNETSAAPSTQISSINCMTGGGDVRMDSSVVKRLAQPYCQKLQKHFPSMLGGNFTATELATDLARVPGGPNYTAVEKAGYVTVFAFLLGESYVDSNTGVLYKQGQPDQCAQDNCTQIFEGIVNRCEWNAHYFGGVNQHLSDCGEYTVYTLNCTDNLLSDECRSWHSKWQPLYTTSSTSAYSVPTNWGWYSYTITLPTTTETNYLPMSTVTGPDWTSLVAMVFTGMGSFVPNPTYNGPVLTPRPPSSSASTSGIELSNAQSHTFVAVATFTEPVPTRILF